VKAPDRGHFSATIATDELDVGGKDGCLKMRVPQGFLFAQRGFTPDWMLVTVGVMAAVLIAGSLIRTAPGGSEAQFGTQMGGLRALSETERLILFEDMGTGPDPAWSGGQRRHDLPGLGAVWMATPPDAPLQRDITLPDGISRAIISFDLIAIDAWAGARLEVAVQGRTILSQSFPSDATAHGQRRLQQADGIALRSLRAAPRQIGVTSGAEGLIEERLNVEIALDQPDPLVRLTLTPQRATPDQPAPAWAVDNLMVIAKDIPPEG
jgi:hypothetical protein